MTFIRQIKPDLPLDPDGYLLVFNSKKDLLVSRNESGSIVIPLAGELNNFFDQKRLIFLGYFNEKPVHCSTAAGTETPEGFEWVNLRGLVRHTDYETWQLIGYAGQINDCHINHRFCGRCGRETTPKTDEQGRYCDFCHLTFYPRISPAIITAVVKENKILLARGVNFPNKKMFSVLAGFVDAQERLEDCVIREVHEETGIHVKDVKYFDSQPWPFPDSLMIGFTAAYESGSIRVDEKELAEAGWFGPDELPLVPGKPTLSGELIQWFVKTHKS